MYQQQKVYIPISDGGVTVKTIKGTGYVYYTTGRVYSPEGKRSNPVRVTIGKQCKDDPTCMIPNEKYGIYFAERIPEELLVEPKRSSCLHIGSYLVIRKIIAEYHLDQIIEEIIGKDAGLFIDLAAYAIITENNAAQHYESYGFNHPLFTNNMRVYSDSKVSDFLNKLEIDQQIEFQNIWNASKDHREKIYISYDSTNKNSEAGDIDLVEIGHSKDDQRLPVFNYSIAYDTKNSVPLFYEAYPGSIVDIQQIQEMLEKAKGYGYKNVGFILDRGYFSQKNIKYLDECGYNFVIMVKGMKKLVNQIIRSVRGKFEQDREKSIRSYKVSGITVKSPLYPTDTKNRYFHVYYNGRKATTEREELEQKIDRYAKYIKNHQGQNIVLDKAVCRYFDPIYYHEGKEDQKLMSAAERTEVINEEIKMCGYFVIITSEPMTAQEALELYKGRDASEKLFRGDKSYLGNQSMRVSIGTKRKNTLRMEAIFMDKKTAMENLAQAAYEKGGFNGTWLYAENGVIVSKGAFGFRDAENKLPMREDTIFEMASVTKMFTATAVMLLVREKKLDLDDEYVKFFPDYPYPGVTIRHLLTHTSGMPDDFETETWVCPAWEDEHRIPPCSEILRFIRDSGEEASHAPGETFRYTDIGYCLLANLVEKLSGVRFEDFLKKNILELSGMKDSGIYHTRRDGRPSNRFARNMVLEDNGYVPSDVSKLTAPYVVGSDGLNGCDYLYTTVFDMLAWDRALREEKVLTREEQKIMFTTVTLNSGEDYVDEDGEGYGFGWGIVNDEEHGLIVSHSGGMPGLNTWFGHFVDEDKTIVILCCRDYTDVRAFVRFWDGLQAIARDEEADPVVSIEDIAVKEPDKSKWESFCGKYEHPEDADFIVDEVFMKDGELYANAIDDEGDDLSFRLYPIGENEFGRKRGMLKLTFGDGCLMFDDFTCKKL